MEFYLNFTYMFICLISKASNLLFQNHIEETKRLFNVSLHVVLLMILHYNLYDYMTFVHVAT